MRVGQSRRRDANERAIVRALRQIGVTIIWLSAPGVPDLLAWTAREGYRLIEVKRPKGKLTTAQQQTRALGVPFCVVTSVAEALALYGVASAKGVVRKYHKARGPKSAYIALAERRINKESEEPCRR